jgi:hypothetical protein
MSNEDKPTWLRQNLLAVITTYNKTMKTRNLMSSSNAYGPEKRKAVIQGALVSLLPENFERTDGTPIEEASIIGTSTSGINTFSTKASGALDNFKGSLNTLGNRMNTFSGFGQRPPAGGRTKKGKKNKNKKSRKSKY